MLHDKFRSMASIISPDPVGWNAEQSPKTNRTPRKFNSLPKPNREKDRLPTTIFQGWFGEPELLVEKGMVDFFFAASQPQDFHPTHIYPGNTAGYPTNLTSLDVFTCTFLPTNC